VSAARATRPAVPARRRPTTWLALALVVVALGMVGFMFASAMLPGHEVLSIGVDGIGDLVYIIPTLVAFLALPAVGAVLASLRPHNAVGWVLLVGGVALGLGDFTLAYVERSVVVGPELPGYQLLDWLSPAFATLAFPLLTVWLPLLFPDGRLPGPRWRVVGLVAVINGVVAVAATLLAPHDGEYGRLLPNQAAIGGEVTALAEFLVGATTLISGGLIVAGVVSVVQRFRRSRATERQQMKWFVAAVALLASMVVVLAALQNAWTWNLMMIAVAFLPIAIGIAILRYRLYDIDHLISRTIGWALVTGILAAVFVGFVIALQALMAGITQGETLAVAASTLAASALFQPLRRRTQQVVDRRFDRARYDGQRTVDEFSEQLRDKVRTSDINRDIRRVIHDTVRPAHLGVWLRSGSGHAEPDQMGRADEWTA
jgi:N-terminal 7TM region of histidine kinase